MCVVETHYLEALTTITSDEHYAHFCAFTSAVHCTEFSLKIDRGFNTPRPHHTDVWLVSRACLTANRVCAKKKSSHQSKKKNIPRADQLVEDGVAAVVQRLNRLQLDVVPILRGGVRGGLASIRTPGNPQTKHR